MKFKIVAVLWTLFDVIYCKQSNLTQSEQIIGKNNPGEKRASMEVCGSVVSFLEKDEFTTKIIGSGAFLTIRHAITSLNPIYQYKRRLSTVKAMAGVYSGAENKDGHEYVIQKIDYNRYAVDCKKRSPDSQFAIVTLESDLQVPEHGNPITIDSRTQHYYHYAIEIGLVPLGGYEQKYLIETPPPSEPIRIPMESEMCDFTVAGRLLVRENHLVAIAVEQQEILGTGFRINYVNLTQYFSLIKDWLYRKISNPTLMAAWGPEEVPSIEEKLWNGGDEYQNESPSQEIK